MTSMEDTYKKTAVAELKKQFGYENIMAVPRLEKVVINTGFGKMIAGKTGEENRKFTEAVLNDLSNIAGQHATLTKAKHSIAGFKVRQGMNVGAKVTLRGKRMHDFLDRFVHVVLPRSRDFRGIPASHVDANGNLSVGIQEHMFFPEISAEKIRDMFGVQITICTSAKSREEGLTLFRALGFPLTDS